MTDLINLFPSLLLAMMIAITLILLPLLNDDRPRRRDDRQTTDKIRLKDEG
jgi:hypothetical protein